MLLKRTAIVTLVAEYYFLMLGVFDLEAEAGIVYPIMASAWVSIPYAVTAACLGTLLAMIVAVALKIDERPDYLRFRRIVGMLNAVAILFLFVLGTVTSDFFGSAFFHI